MVAVVHTMLQKQLIRITWTQISDDLLIFEKYYGKIPGTNTKYYFAKQNNNATLSRNRQIIRT